jgi:hypothetical protein
MFEKPSEMILHRPLNYGGLGLHSPKYKALAGFISTFLQTAANASFRQNLLHNQLYRKHILNEDDVPGAPNQLPPYFSKDFFKLIRDLKSRHALDITTMTERDWTILLTEEFITMEEDQETNTSVFRSCRVEPEVLTLTGLYPGPCAGSRASPRTWPPSCGRCSTTS